MRSDLTDCRLAPVENLATNPNFERVTPGSTIVRTNLFANPIPNRTTDGFGGVRMALSYDSVGGFNRWTVTDTNSAANSQRWGVYPSNTGGTNGPVCTPGRTYTVSFDVRMERAHQVRLVPLQNPGTGFGVVSGTAVTINDVVPGAWKRVSVTFVAPAGAQRIGFEAGFSDTAERVMGETVDVRRVLIEERPAALPYFDGNSVNDRGIAYAWTGTAGASSSVARAAVVEVRRNHCKAPLLSRTLDGWAYSFVTPTVVSDGAQLDFPSATTGVNSFFYPSAMTVIPASPTTAATASVEVSVPAGFPTVQVAMWHYCTKADGVNSTGWVQGPAVTIAAGERKTVANYQASFPAETGWSRPSLRTAGNIPAGARLIVHDGALFEAGVGPGATFHGGLTPDADLAPAWLGTENASASVLYGISPAWWTSGSDLIPVLTYLNPGRPGRPSVRLIPFGAVGTVNAVFRGPTGVFRAGETYTVLAKLTLTGPMAAGTVSRQLQVRRSDGSFSGLSDIAPNVAGSTVLRLTFTAVSSSEQLRFDNREGAGGASSYLSDVAIVQGAYTGPYLDGDLPGCLWRGTPHASVSVGYPRLG